MPITFSINLSTYPLWLGIGGKRITRKRKLEAFDLINALAAMGFSNIDSVEDISIVNGKPPTMLTDMLHKHINKAEVNAGTKITIRLLGDKKEIALVRVHGKYRGER